MTHLTTEEAARIYRIAPHQLRRKSAADPTWPQPLVIGRRTYRWDEAECREHAKKLKRRHG